MLDTGLGGGNLLVGRKAEGLKLKAEGKRQKA